MEQKNALLLNVDLLLFPGETYKIQGPLKNSGQITNIVHLDRRASSSNMQAYPSPSPDRGNSARFI